MAATFLKLRLTAGPCLLGLALLGGLAAGRAETWDWEAAGIGGGGRFIGPGISPLHPDLLLSSSDMGGVYRSADGGRTWQMPPQAMLRRPQAGPARPDHLWAFHPLDPQLVFVGTSFGFFRSDDAGITWKPVDGGWNDRDSHGNALRRGPRVVAFDLPAPDHGVAVFDATAERNQVSVWSTRNRGGSWQALAPLPSSAGKVVNSLVFPDAMVIATSGGVFRSEDAGAAWNRCVTGLPDAAKLRVIDCDGAPENGSGMLYLSATDGEDKDPAHARLYVSPDAGLTWKPVPHPGPFGLLAVSAAAPSVVYAVIAGGFFRSDDRAQTWRPVWFHDTRSGSYNISNDSWLKGRWGWDYPPSGISVSSTDAKHVFATTICGAFDSRDGGETWRQVHAPDGTKDAQAPGGMMVTSVWSYAIHPAEPQRRLMALTDYSGWRSADSGHTWRYRPDGNPWHNNTYAHAFDPARPARVWAACSITHDLPTWRYQSGLGTYVGGVVVSSDGGENWTPVAKDSGLPRKAVTDLWLDPSSPRDKRRLWAALPGMGAYASEDDGLTWQAHNQGISAENRNVLRIKGDATGRLFALTTVRVRGNARIPGSLYLSTDRGASWKPIFSVSEAPFLTWMELPPGQPGVIYVTALHTRDGWENANGGGVWKSTDAGQNWTRVFDKPAYAVAADPHDPARLFASCWAADGDGLHTSTDAGATWTRIDSYPFWRPLTITFDPTDRDAIFVTNFGGGVFRGRRK